VQAECGLDVVNADVAGGHEAGIELYPHGEFLGAVDEHLRHASIMEMRCAMVVSPNSSTTERAA